MSDKAAPSLADIEARVGAATPGPWWTEGKTAACYAHIPGGRPNGEGIIEARYCGRTVPNAFENATLIANAPTDLAALTAAVRAVLAALDETAATYGETCDRLTMSLMTNGPTPDITGDDVNRYAAYAASWRSAAKTARAALSAHIDIEGGK